MSSQTSLPRPIDVALQGGGSHGAFTWGALDRLLEDESLDISAISGTSAGALNAAVFACGYARGGREGARQALDAFWRDVSRAGAMFSAFAGQPPSATTNPFGFENMPGYQWMSSLMRSLSPYDFNPLNLNPLREALSRHVDEPVLRRSPIRVFVTATRVNTGQPRVFSGSELTIDALLASACLPFVFQAVEIDGEPYWDGGYVGNPAIFPLIYDTSALDVLLVKIIPLSRPDTPRSSLEIMDRMSEITFNASLISEMRAIDFVTRLLKEHKVDTDRYKALRLHMIADERGLSAYDPSSKFNTDIGFLETLFELGRQAAGRWMRNHADDVGVRSSLDIGRVFLKR